MTDTVTVEYVQTGSGRVHKRYITPSGSVVTDERDNLDQAHVFPFIGDADALPWKRKCRRCFRA